MKFKCAECGSQYNISDDKVAGKLLKIRCRKCSHVNSVDGREIKIQAATADQKPEAAAPPVGPAKGDDPAPADASMDALRKGTLTLSLADLKLPEEDAPARVISKTQQLAAVNIPDSDQALAAFPGAADNNDDTKDSSVPENTRMAIAQAGMAHRAAKHRSYALIAVLIILGLIGVVVADALEIIEVPLLHRAVVAAKIAAGVKPKTKPWTSMMTKEERAAIRKALLEGNSAEATRIKQRVRRRARKKAKEENFAIDLSDQVGQQIVTEQDLKRHDHRGAMAIDLNADQSAAMQDIMKRGDVKATRINVRQNVPEVKVATRSEGGLSPEQIGKVVAQNQGGIQFCATQETKRGIELPPKLNITVTVVGYGKVTAASIDDPAYAKAPLGRCLIGKAKIWKFPEFTGEAVDIDIPLKFTTAN